MARIVREVEAAAATRHDVVIAGGGAYGLMLLRGAARRGLRALLVERDDFAGATSRNNLRIVHGGLRYLQRLDVRRYAESVRERRWFLRRFAGFVEPLPCLMPLYGRGLRRPAVMRLGLAANDRLSPRRNAGLRPDRTLPAGRVLAPDATAERHPGVRRDGLRGAAFWHDAFVPDPARLWMEVLHEACSAGARALNYVEARELLLEDGRVCGLRARDHQSGRDHELLAPLVVNAAGPWSRELAGWLDRDRPELFEGTLAWNVLLDRPAPADCALGVEPPRRDAQTYFLVPWQGRLLAGTGHAPWRSTSPVASLPPEPLADFLADLGAAAPGLDPQPQHVLRVYAGLLPAARAGSTRLAGRPVILDHGAEGGPRGLWSVSGVKFTTAHAVAERTLDRALPGRAPEDDATSPADPGRLAWRRFGPDWTPEDDPHDWRADLTRLVRDEAVVHLDDLLLRRTALGDDPRTARRVAGVVASIFDWDAARRARECQRLERALGRAAPGAAAA